MIENMYNIIIRKSICIIQKKYSIFSFCMFEKSNYMLKYLKMTQNHQRKNVFVKSNKTGKKMKVKIQ